MGPVVFFDCESDISFARAAGEELSEKLKNMQATVICALSVDVSAIDAACTRGTELDSDVHSRLVCWRDDNTLPDGPFAPLLDLFDRASVIVAYNGSGFDMPLLRKYYQKGCAGGARYLKHRLKLLDPFMSIRTATGSAPSLDKLLKLNGLPTKTSSGLEAIRMWEDGRREELLSYCQNDVDALARLTLRRTPIVYADTHHGQRHPKCPAAHFSVPSALHWARDLAGQPNERH